MASSSLQRMIFFFNCMLRMYLVGVTVHLKYHVTRLTSTLRKLVVWFLLGEIKHVGTVRKPSSVSTGLHVCPNCVYIIYLIPISFVQRQTVTIRCFKQLCRLRVDSRFGKFQPKWSVLLMQNVVIENTGTCKRLSFFFYLPLEDYGGNNGMLYIHDSLFPGRGIT